MQRFSRVMFCVCGMLVSSAQADSGFYFGVFGGTADYEFVAPRATGVPILTAASPNPPTTIAIPSVAVTSAEPAYFPGSWFPGEDDSSTAWGVTAGYRIGRYAAFELAYLDLGRLHESGTVPFYPAGTTSYRRELEITGPTISAIGTLPIVGGWSVYARGGAFFAQMNLKNALGNYSDEISFGSQGALWGVGTQWDWGDHWSVRVDFQRLENVGETMEAGRADIDLLTLGVLFRL